MKLEYVVYVIGMRCSSDDESTLQLVKLGMCGSSPSLAWTRFFSTIQHKYASRAHMNRNEMLKEWKKRGYVAQPVHVTVTLVQNSTKSKRPRSPTIDETVVFD